MKIKIHLTFLLILIIVSTSTSEASIVSNTELVYISGSPPDIIDEPTLYLLTNSDFQQSVKIDTMNAEYDGAQTCLGNFINGKSNGYITDSECIGKRVTQEIYTLNSYGGITKIYNIQIYTFRPNTDFSIIWKNINSNINSGSDISSSSSLSMGDKSIYIIWEGNAGLQGLDVQSGNIMFFVHDIFGDEQSKQMLINIAQKYLDKLSQIKANEPNLIIQANADKTNLEVGDIFTISFKSTSKALITIKNNNAVIDSFVLPQSDSRSYKVDKAGGEELIEIIGVTAKGKQDTTQLRITTKEKWTPTPTPTQTLMS